VTPFGPDQQVLNDELARQAEWVIDRGANAIVYPGVISEFFALSDQERRDGLRVVLEATGGRVPVVAGVSAPSAPVAAELARDADAAGASALMAMMPYVPHFFAPTKEYAYEYFQMVAEATPLPIVLQNARIGHPLNAAVVTEIAGRIPSIRYVKEESFPGTHALATAIAAVGRQVDGVFGGLGGVYLSQELERGAIGTMPSPALVDVLIRVYRLWQAGSRDRARELLGMLGGFFTLELLYNVSLVKEVLRQRGIITSTKTRVPAPVLDAIDLAEIVALLEGLSAIDADAALGTLS
jgi:4-hydroxy-tetrahydrodipicolinate synthase